MSAAFARFEQAAYALRAEGQALADMVGEPGGVDPKTGKYVPPTGMYQTRAQIYRKLNQWQREEQAFQTAERERTLERLELEGDTLATRLTLFLEEAVDNDPSLTTQLMATFVASTRELIPGMAAGDLGRKLQIGHDTTMWDWIGGVGDALTFVAPIAKVTGGVRQTLQALRPTVAATKGELRALAHVITEDNVKIAIRATDPITAQVTKVLNWLKVPAKPEKLKAKSLYGIAFGAVGQKADSKATGIARVWEFLGIMRSDLDIAWIKRATTRQPLLGNADTLAMGKKLDDIGGTGAYQHGSHATVGPRGGGPLGFDEMYKAGDVGEVIEFSAEGTMTFSAAQSRRFLLGRGRYSADWFNTPRKSTLIGPYPALFVKGAGNAGEQIVGKDRGEK